MQIFPALTASLAGNILDSRAGVNTSHTDVKEAHREQEVGARFMKTKAVRTVRHVLVVMAMPAIAGTASMTAVAEDQPEHRHFAGR